MAGSQAITNNTASCFYYFITDFAEVGIFADGRKPGKHQQHSILFFRSWVVFLEVVGVRVDGR
jgi:hypothetical protein